jgi:hypothetical protein
MKNQAENYLSCLTYSEEQRLWVNLALDKGKGQLRVNEQETYWRICKLLARLAKELYRVPELIRSLVSARHPLEQELSQVLTKPR